MEQKTSQIKSTAGSPGRKGLEPGRSSPCGRGMEHVLDVSDDCSFLLESSVLDRDVSGPSPSQERRAVADVPVSLVQRADVGLDDESFLLAGYQEVVREADPDDSGWTLPRTSAASDRGVSALPLGLHSTSGGLKGLPSARAAGATPQYKQEISSSLYDSRGRQHGSTGAMGARTDFDASGISEGVTGDESSWSVPASPPPAAQDEAAGWASRAAGATREAMEQRLDPLQLAFSSPISASHAGSSLRAIPRIDRQSFSMKERHVASATGPCTGKSRDREGKVSSIESGNTPTTSVCTASTTDVEIDRLRDQIMETNAVIADMSAHGSVQATVGTLLNPSSPRAAILGSHMKGVPGTAKNTVEKRQERTVISGALAAHFVPDMDYMTPSQAKIQRLLQLLEKKDDEIARLRDGEDDLSMELDRVVLELQNDIKQSKQSSTAFQEKLQDQVHQMGDYILHLESQLKHFKQTVSIRRSTPSFDGQHRGIYAQRLALLVWAGATKTRRTRRCALIRFITRCRHSAASSAFDAWIHHRHLGRERVCMHRKAAGRVQRLQRRLITKMIEIWSRATIATNEVAKRAFRLRSKIVLRAQITALNLSFRYLEAFCVAEKRRRRVIRCVSGKKSRCCKRNVISSWMRHAQREQWFGTKSANFGAKLSYRCRIRVLSAWRETFKRKNLLRRSIRLCRVVAVEFCNPNGNAFPDNDMTFVTRHLLAWVNQCHCDPVRRVLSRRMHCLAQKRNLAHSISRWRCEVRTHEDHAVEKQRAVVEAVRQSILRLAYQCFWGWVAFLHARQETQRSILLAIGTQRKSVVAGSFSGWAGHIVIRQQCESRLQNALRRRHRCLLQLVVIAWKEREVSHRILEFKAKSCDRRRARTLITKFWSLWSSVHFSKQLLVVNFIRFTQRKQRRRAIFAFSGWSKLAHQAFLTASIAYAMTYGIQSRTLHKHFFRWRAITRQRCSTARAMANFRQRQVKNMLYSALSSWQHDLRLPHSDGLHGNFPLQNQLAVDVAAPRDWQILPSPNKPPVLSSAFRPLSCSVSQVGGEEEVDVTLTAGEYQQRHDSFSPLSKDDMIVMLNGALLIRQKKKKWSLQQRFFSIWSWRVENIAHVIHMAKAIYRRRIFKLARQSILQMMQNVRDNLRMQALGRMQPRMRKELGLCNDSDRRLQFIDERRGVNLPFHRSIKIWSFAIWRVYIRSLQQRSQKKSAANHKMMHRAQRTKMCVFTLWAKMWRSRRSNRHFLASRMQKKMYGALLLSFVAWRSVTKYLRQLDFKEASVLRSHRARRTRCIFALFALHAQILGRMRRGCLGMIVKQSQARLLKYLNAWMVAAYDQKLSRDREQEQHVDQNQHTCMARAFWRLWALNQENSCKRLQQQGLMQRLSDRQFRRRGIHAFIAWSKSMRYNKWMRRKSERSRLLFERGVFSRCARFWFAAHIRRRNRQEHLESVLALNEHTLVSQILREWSLASRRARYVPDLVGMQKVYLRMFDGVFLSFRRQHVLRKALSFWSISLEIVRLKASSSQVIQTQMKMMRAGRCKRVCATMLTRWLHVRHRVQMTQILFQKARAKVCDRRTRKVFDGLLAFLCEQKEVSKANGLRRSHAQRLAMQNIKLRTLSCWRRSMVARQETVLCLSRFVRQRTRRTIAGCFGSWNNRIVSQADVTDKALRRTKRRRKRNVWFSWARYMARKANNRQWQRHITQVVQCRLTRPVVSEAFSMWVTNAIAARRMRKILARIQMRVRKIRLVHVWAKWTWSVSFFTFSSFQHIKVLHHLSLARGLACMRQIFRNWLQVVVAKKIDANAPQRQSSLIENMYNLVRSVHGKRRMISIFRSWRGMVVRYASLKQVARAIMMQKYYFVLSKHLNVWKLVKHFSRQHANHVSQESMTIRIRVLSTRCYDHVARQSLQLRLRRHFRAWYDVSVRLQELAMKIQRSKACCLNRHLKSWRQCLCRRAGVLLALAHLSSSLLITNEQQNKERLHSCSIRQKALYVGFQGHHLQIKKAAFELWHLKYLLTRQLSEHLRNLLSNLQRSRVSAQGAASTALLRWVRYTKRKRALESKVSAVIFRRVRAGFVEHFVIWHDAVLQSRETEEASSLLMLRSQNMSQQQTISRLKHLSCAQLFRSTLHNWQHKRAEKSFAFRALAAHVLHKKLRWRLQRVSLASLIIHRNRAQLQGVLKTWKHMIFHKLVAELEGHLETSATLAADMESWKCSRQLELDNIISSLRSKVMKLESELCETQTLLHASCDAFLPESADFESAVSLHETVHKMQEALSEMMTPTKGPLQEKTNMPVLSSPQKSISPSKSAYRATETSPTKAAYTSGESGPCSRWTDEDSTSEWGVEEKSMVLQQNIDLVRQREYVEEQILHEQAQKRLQERMQAYDRATKDALAQRHQTDAIDTPTNVNPEESR